MVANANLNFLIRVGASYASQGIYALLSCFVLLKGGLERGRSLVRVVSVTASSLARLTWCRGGKVVLLSLSVVMPLLVNFAQWCTVRGTAVGRCSLTATKCCLLYSSNGCGRSWVRGGKLSSNSTLNALLNPPLSECTLVEVQPVLLWSDNHTRSHEAHKGYNLISSKAVAVDKICTNQASSSSETSLAVNSNALLLDGNGFMGQADKLAHGCERRASSVVKDHIEMLNAEGLKV